MKKQVIKHSFLCTTVVVNPLDQVLAEESFVVEVKHHSEFEGMKLLEKRLIELESLCSVGTGNFLLLHVHCVFPMMCDVTMELLSEQWLISRFNFIFRL